MDDAFPPGDLAGLSPETRARLNGPLSPARNVTMLALIGAPRATWTTTCQPVTNPRIAGLIDTEADVGPFHVSGLGVAVAALRQIMATIRDTLPEVHGRLGSAGMLCCRLVRGSATAISNHAWGTAIDLTVDGATDPRGDPGAQAALLAVHPVFNRFGFYWGAAFRAGDATHFEASEQLVRRWAREGRFGAVAAGAPTGLTIGDRGVEVERLQTALNSVLRGDAVSVDGVFGKDTRAGVAEFQRRGGLPPDGIATARTRCALGLP